VVVSLSRFEYPISNKESPIYKWQVRWAGRQLRLGDSLLGVGYSIAGSEPQNVEQGMSNFEVLDSTALLHHSTIEKTRRSKKTDVLYVQIRTTTSNTVLAAKA
jgi:hypothetical protein